MAPARENAIQTLFTIYGIVDTFNELNDTIIETEVSGDTIYLKYIDKDGKTGKSQSFERQKLEDFWSVNTRKFLDYFIMELKHLSGIKKKSLPSRFQIGDLVEIKFKPWLVVDKAEIIKIHFSESKVLYDLEVSMYPGSDRECFTRIYNIDSAIVDEYVPGPVRINTQ